MKLRRLRWAWHVTHVGNKEEILDPGVNRFMQQTLPTANRKHFFKNILCIEFSCPQKKKAQENAAPW
jgi:hypothetical protein